ncbi:MAG: hypothetical protein ABIV04_04690 [Massilia sp.]
MKIIDFFVNIFRPASRLGFLVVIFISNNAFAACSDVLNWLTPPDRDSKIFVDYMPHYKGNFDEIGVIQTADYLAFPPPLPKAMLPLSGTEKLSETRVSKISFYENDGKGSWRICRLEIWWPLQFVDNVEDRDAMQEFSREYSKANPFLSSIAKTHLAFGARNYFYDKKGRLIRIEFGDFTKLKQGTKILTCREYDDQDRLILLLNPENSKKCANGSPDLRDEWLRLRYAEDEKGSVREWEELHSGDHSAAWSKRFERFTAGKMPEVIHGSALAKSKKGLTIIFHSNAGKLDDNAANTVVDSFGRWLGATYYFTKPSVPLSVLNAPDTLYRYERRRETRLDSGQVMMYELFPPSTHVSRHRYYYFREVLRNEQFDAFGKLTRVITVNDWRQPRPGPHPALDDTLLQAIVPRLMGHQIYHRVYKVDANRIPKLIGVSWNRKVTANRTPMDLAEVVYGTPDGKVRWKSQEEFQKHFDFSPVAAQVFPDESGGRESEHF